MQVAQREGEVKKNKKLRDNVSVKEHTHSSLSV